MDPYRIVKFYADQYTNAWRVVRDVPTTREEIIAQCSTQEDAERIANLLNQETV
jgi:hypothetical protein